MRLDHPTRELDPLAHTRMQVTIVQEHGAERTELDGALPARDLVVESSGISPRERRQLRVLVDLALPAVGDRDRQPRPRDRGIVPCNSRASVLASESSGPTGPPLLDQLLRMRRRNIDLANGAARTTPQTAATSIASPASRRPPRAAETHPAAARPATPSARAASASAPARRRDDRPRAERLGRLIDRERLLGVPRVAAAQHGRVRRGPRRQVVITRDDHRPRGTITERRTRERATDRRAAHPGDDQTPRRLMLHQVRRLHPPERVGRDARASPGCPPDTPTCRPRQPRRDRVPRARSKSDRPVG